MGKLTNSHQTGSIWESKETLPSGPRPTEQSCSFNGVDAGTKLKGGYGSPSNPKNIPFHRAKTVVEFTSAGQLIGPRTVCEQLFLKGKVTEAAVEEFETRLGPDGRRSVPTINRFMNRVRKQSGQFSWAIDCFLELWHYTFKNVFTEISDSELFFLANQRIVYYEFFANNFLEFC